jgi:hypothetical protein
MLKRLFGSKKVEVSGSWRELRIYGFRNLYSSTNIISVIKSKEAELEEA